ncbi:hypothetical protein BRADI_1g48681v3 [Brachypodium distachyon]|uniref:Uncharacterized protein n=1 Tax=Brachypodium distachyon TaxID=15368 RepID=A0A2K2DQC7_BRADI|nr:hypothetical protein BRADI_1g48681v3 [Brachypodium distachyon]PNT76479.1 hypothetical protein BRADI_1g48681v3 [Brachypodium distachyon]PNT76480.1 hypothetical protein BRADI_1g48681v3 [Brachypodium distachyon]PNT76481.1 hypothetical protein BRADI_1g48681v3 [Brachypodium distachyon]PNT76482.1 hypothetical protein BRADI_1g48681v3 [Brachypodium distachyon]
MIISYFVGPCELDENSDFIERSLLLTETTAGQNEPFYSTRETKSTTLQGKKEKQRGMYKLQLYWGKLQCRGEAS